MKEEAITQDAPEFESGFPAMRYCPSDRAPGFEYVIVNSSAEEKALGDGWYMNPGDFGVEINPGKKPDPAISANKVRFERGKATPIGATSESSSKGSAPVAAASATPADTSSLVDAPASGASKKASGKK